VKLRTLALSLQPLAFAFLLVGCRSYGPRFDPKATEAPRPDAVGWIGLTNQLQPEWLAPNTNLFRLGAGDIITIEVLGEANSQVPLTVGPDGKIYYSLLPGTVVSGLTLTETKDNIEKQLARHLRAQPTLSVTLRSAASKHVWVLGSVQSPGTYPLSTPTTVLEAVSSAGGVISVPGSHSGSPNLQNSFLLRDGKVVPVNFQRLLSEGDLRQNVYLQPDDFLYLRSSVSRDVYVLGAVAAPRVLPYSDRLSLLSALANAGGTLPYAQVTHVGIIRGSLASPRIGFVDYKSIYKGKGQDVLLQEGDIVYVPFVPYEKVARLADQMVTEFVRTIAINEGTRAAVPNARPTSIVVPLITAP
jgi:polysaccharide biosynthesis/export protein